ncbi:MAG: S-layer homology domain-containing protein [Ruminococcaceae bacterium]|nr:S-layer homology domain-containing protein [Oscillospiraceae bacterium]
MKKVLCLILSLLMVFSNAVFAQNTEITPQEEEFKKLVLTAKNALDIDEEKYVFDTYSKRGDKLNLMWKSKDETQNGYVNVTIDTEGDVLNYSTDFKYEGKYDFSSEISNEKIKQITQDFINKAAPNKCEEYKFDKILVDINSPLIGVQYKRYINGIDVSTSSLTFDIDQKTEKIVNYSMNYQKIDNIDSIEGIKTYDEAVEIYKEKLGYSLIYNIYSDGKNVKSYLNYAPNFPYSNSIEAKDGKVFKGSYIMMNPTFDSNSKEESVMGSLSKEEQIVYDELKNLPSKEDAIAYAKGIEEFKITDEYKAIDYSIYKDLNGKYICTVRFEIENEDPKVMTSHKSLTMRLDNFEILSYSFYDVTAKEDMPKIDSGILKESAKDIGEKYFAEKIEKCKLDVENTNGIKYQRYENGIKVNSNGISINMNEVTGELESIWTTWHDLEFEKITPKKSLDDLYSEIINENSFGLVYALVQKDLNAPYDQREYDAVLVYTLNAHDSFDVNTLDWLDYKGEIIKDTSYKEYKDLDNHYVKDYAIKLAKLGVYYEDENFRPDEIATQKDFISLLSKANGYNDVIRFYKRAERDFLDEDKVDENAPLKRMDAIRYAVNYKGYKEIAKIYSMFKTHFTDVPSDMVGYASLAAGLKIVSDKVDKLNGDNYLTRAEALVIVYNLLNN